jgi:hypothetical protein
LRRRPRSQLAIKQAIKCLRCPYTSLSGEPRGLEGLPWHGLRRVAEPQLCCLSFLISLLLSPGCSPLVIVRLDALYPRDLGGSSIVPFRIAHQGCSRRSHIIIGGHNSWPSKSGLQLQDGETSLPAGLAGAAIGIAMRDHRTPNASFENTGRRSTNPTSTDCSIQLQQFGGKAVVVCGVQQQTYTSVFSIWTGLTQSRRCSSQSLRWCSAEQYLTNLHLLQTCPRTAGRTVSMLPFPFVEEEHLLLASPTGTFPENATSQSIQLHISRARTRRKLPRLRPRFNGRTAAPSRPCLGNRIISQSSVQHGLGQPDGKSKKISAAGTKSGCVKKICE